MPVIRCPACGLGGEVPATFRERAVKCRKCATVFQIRNFRWVRKAALGLLVLLATGAALYFAIDYAVQKLRPIPPSNVEDVAETNPAAQAEDRSAEERRRAEAARRSDQLAKIEEEVRTLEAAQNNLDSRKRGLEEQRQQLDRVAKELDEKKARYASEQAEYQSALRRRNPTLTVKMEEVARTPDLYYGQFMYCDGLTIVAKTVEKHKELDRFTLTATSAAGVYYSRVPLGSLFFSTSDTVANALPRHVNADGELRKIRVYCELKKWERKTAPNKPVPEAFIYRIDIFTVTGDLSKTLE